MNTLDSLPPVPQGSIDHMKKASTSLVEEHERELAQEYQHPRSEAPIDNYLSAQQEPVEEEPAPQMPETFSETSVGKNLRALREKAERAERERYEILRKAEQAERERDELKRQLEERKKSATQNDQQEQDDHDFDIDPDALIEGRHLKKMYNEIKTLKNEVHKYQTQTHEEQMQLKINAQFPDFDAVVTSENLRELADTEPEIANMIRASGDLYTGAVTAYKMIKKFNIGQQPEKKIVQSNYTKPRSSNAVRPQTGDTPLSRANQFSGDLTPELRAQLFKEMERSRNS